ncbi:MAG: hypothetical protein Q8N18_18330 [Opitutaceae bacterium]|nr:hypothetical protein [Opitutaceae bacterium]
MAGQLNIERLNEALSLLGERLRLSGGEPQELVVCGGSSLIARGYVSRVTRDVDVVARRLRGSELVSAKPLPEAVVAAVARVAADLGLPLTWLNNGPADLFELGLPGGFASRLESHVYGSHLTVWHIGRVDQIHFKLYAAADQGGGHHVTDLLALNPTADELLAAAQWTFTHDASPAFRALMKAILKEMNHDDVARQL